MAQVESGRDDIQIETREESAVVRSLTVQVDASRVDSAFSKAYASLRKSARVKGFRPGKVPTRVLKELYGATMPDEVERVLVQETLPDAVELASLEPISEPQIEADRPAEGEVFKYTVRVEVKPEITLPDLSELIGLKPPVEVRDEEVQAELERLRERQAPWVEVEEGVAAANGHQLNVDFVGRIDGEAFEGGTAQGVDIELGSQMMIPGFEEQLVGARSGEDREIEVTFPDEYGQPELAGKTATFAVHVAAIKSRELPDLDDEFAKDLGDFETLADLEARIRGDMTKARERQSEETLHRSLLEALVSKAEFEVPTGVVDRQLQNEMRSMHQRFHGQVPEDALHQQLARMQHEGRPMAERRVREAFLLEAIAKQHGLAVEEGDVESRLEELAEAQGIDAKLMKDMAKSQGWHAQIEAEVLDRKALAHLVEHAQVVAEPAEAEPASNASDAPGGAEGEGDDL